MGMTSILIISNDHLRMIENDEHFGRRVDSDVRTFQFATDRDSAALGSRGAVVSVGHADSEQIVSVQHGRGAPLPLDELEALWKYRRSRDRKAKRAAKEKDGA